METEKHLSEQVPNCSLLLYSHDGFGLGHLKRNFNIACGAQSVIPGVQSLLIMGHSCVPFHPIPKGIDFLKVPSIIKVENERWEPRGLNAMNEKNFKSLRASLIKTAATHFKPDIFLVDYVPKGVWGELLPTLKFLKEHGTKIVLGLRDIIDDPKVTTKRWRSARAYQVMRDYYDQIFIYGVPEVFDTAKEYGLVGDLAEKVKYCGYLTSKETYHSQDKVRRDLGLSQEKLIVVTAGGGGDAYPMMKVCLEALMTITKAENVRVLLVAGPLMPHDLRQDLEKRCHNESITIVPSIHRINHIMNAADLLITMGSYNTLMEGISMGRPALVIPRSGPSAEQRMRAKTLSDLGYVRALEPSETLTCDTLRAAIEESLTHWTPPKVPLNMDGLDSALTSLKQLWGTTLQSEIKKTA